MHNEHTEGIVAQVSQKRPYRWVMPEAGSTSCFRECPRAGFVHIQLKDAFTQFPLKIKKPFTLHSPRVWSTGSLVGVTLPPRRHLVMAGDSGLSRLGEVCYSHIACGGQGCC